MLCINCNPRAVQPGPSAAGNALQNPPLFPGWKLRQDRNQPRFLLGDQAIQGQIRVRRLKLWTALDQIIARHDQLENKRRIEPLIPRRRLFDRVDDRLQLRLRFVEFVVKLDDLIERGRLLLRLARLTKERDQFVRPRNLFAPAIRSARSSWLE